VLGIRERCAFIVTALAAALALATARPASADDRLVLIAGSSGTAPYDVLDHVAERAGFYAAEHLSVDHEYTANPYTAAQLVATGKGDICAATIEPILAGYDKGLRLPMFLARASRYTYAMGVLDESPIRTLADFKGTEIGVPTLGNGAVQAAQSMLAGAGLGPGEYSFAPIGQGAQALEALLGRRVAGVAFPFGAIVPFEVMGHKMRVFRNPTLGDISNAGYFATPATIATRADALARFSRAIVEAAVFVRENPDVSARYFIEGTGSKVTPEALHTWIATLRLSQRDLLAADPSSRRIGAISPNDVGIFTAFLAASGQTKELVPAADVMTNRFIPFANAFDRTAVIALARKAR
jgi:NitT/TauT family transport system substrate-binding protein